MSGHQYVANPDSLFEDDDVDDETFLRYSKKSTNPFEEQKQTFEQKKQEIENRTIESSQRSLGLLYETEEVGKATAIELAKQREQLEKSSRQLDEISATLRFSQKHLNGLKSVFGGLKNYLSGNRDMPGRTNISPTSVSKISDEYSNSQPPSQPLSPNEDYYQRNHPIKSDVNEDAMYQQQRQKMMFEEKLEQNLEEMCGGLSRLKGLATDMRSEIESQNDLLDNMNYKMEDVDIKITKQKKDMDKLLGNNKQINN